MIVSPSIATEWPSWSCRRAVGGGQLGGLRPAGARTREHVDGTPGVVIAGGAEDGRVTVDRDRERERVVHRAVGGNELVLEGMRTGRERRQPEDRERRGEHEADRAR